MRVRDIVAATVLAIGAAWQWGMAILSQIGRMLDAVQLGDYVTDLQVWLANSPTLANDVGPWVLMSLGCAALFVTHAGKPLYDAIVRPPLEIVYDPDDPNRRFARVGDWYLYQSHEYERCFILRLGIINRTKRTIRRVTATLETDFLQDNYPPSLRFTRTLELEHDLDPGQMELMDLLGLPEEQEQWAMPDGVHNIIVRFRGIDTQEQEAVFYFDKRRMPPLSWNP